MVEWCLAGAPRPIPNQSQPPNLQAALALMDLQIHNQKAGQTPLMQKKGHLVEAPDRHLNN